MCGRFTLTAEAADIINHYGLSTQDIPEYKKTYNAAPAQQILSVIHDGKDYRAGYIQWGLPSIQKGGKPGKLTTNARSETLQDYALFRESFQRRRIIIPADSFLESINTDNGKQPIRIMLSSGALFSLAAIYESWKTPEGKQSACVIITTEPNRHVAQYHNRMPVILNDEEEAIWLNRNVNDMKLLRLLLKPYRADLMTSYPVSRLANDVHYNSPMLLKEINLDEKLF